MLAAEPAASSLRFPPSCQAVSPTPASHAHDRVLPALVDTALYTLRNAATTQCSYSCPLTRSHSLTQHTRLSQSHMHYLHITILASARAPTRRQTERGRGEKLPTTATLRNARATRIHPLDRTPCAAAHSDAKSKADRDPSRPPTSSTPSQGFPKQERKLPCTMSW